MDAIATHLEQQPEAVRIKKLLYAIIHTRWENAPAVLAQQSMADLVTTVHAMAPTEAELSHHLERIVQRLNRQSRYTQIALVISDAFHPLHRSSETPTVVPPDMTTLEGTTLEQTVMTPRDLPPSEEPLASETRLESGAPGANDLTLAEIPNSPDSAACQALAVKPRHRANLFGLRLEIMRYTNPLRAKILLLSTVRSPFTFNQQDWITLKSKTLDDLLQEAFDYCSTYADLESKLTIMCHCVDNATENTQVAGAILQAMKPFYPDVVSS